MDKIVCVGKNYLEHVKELGDAIPEKPVLFIKPPSVLRVAFHVDDQIELRIPPDSGEIHHECEIVLRLNHDGYRMTLEEARAAIADVSLGLDMTLRERQAQLKKAGHPWEISKTFLDSAVVGTWVPLKDFPNLLDEPFFFKLDGAVTQTGRARDMTYDPATCVAYISQYFPLKSGDLIFTGTPAGVGPVRAGQVAELVWGKVRYSVRWKPYS